LIGEIIYDTFESTQRRCARGACYTLRELEKKMVTAFNKAAEIKPESELP
jgi:hypothetical protein